MPRERKPKQIDLTKFFQSRSETFLTGVLPLDVVLDGGNGRGDVIEMTSASGIGKTTMMMSVLKNLLAKGETCAYLDVERGVKNKSLECFGITTPPGEKVGDQFLLMYPTDFLDLEQVFNGLVTIEKPYQHVIIDSISAVIVAGAEELSVVDVRPGMWSRQAAQFFSKFKARLRDAGTTLWLINQLRAVIDFNAPSSKAGEQDSAGGNIVKYYSDIRLRMDGGEAISAMAQTPTGEKKVINGNYAWLYGVKNRAGRPFVKIRTPILFGKGVSNLLFLEEALKNLGIIQGGHGGNYSVVWKGRDDKVRGTEELYKYLRDVAKELVEYLRETGQLKVILEKGIEGQAGSSGLPGDEKGGS